MEETLAGIRCACIDGPWGGSMRGFPGCDALMRRYPSGNIACDCGAHVITPATPPTTP